MSAVAALVNLFFIHEKSAYEEQVQTDAILDGKKEEPSEPASQSSQPPPPPKSKGDEIEETVAKCNNLSFFLLCIPYHLIIIL